MACVMCLKLGSMRVQLLLHVTEQSVIRCGHCVYTSGKCPPAALGCSQVLLMFSNICQMRLKFDSHIFLFLSLFLHETLQIHHVSLDFCLLLSQKYDIIYLQLSIRGYPEWNPDFSLNISVHQNAEHLRSASLGVSSAINQKPYQWNSVQSGAMPNSQYLLKL